MVRVTQCEDLFDSLPAVRAAFLFTKDFFNSEVSQEEEAERLEKEPTENIEKDISNSTEEEKSTLDTLETTTRVEEKLEFQEFRMFLQALRQYFLYCQVIKY